MVLGLSGVLLEDAVAEDFRKKGYIASVCKNQ